MLILILLQKGAATFNTRGCVKHVLSGSNTSNIGGCHFRHCRQSFSAMPIHLNPAVTSKPEVIDEGKPSPDEELLDLDTPSCSPTARMLWQPDYYVITDKEGNQRPRRTVANIF